VLTDKQKDTLAISALLLLSSCAFIRLLALPAFEDEGTALRWISRAINFGEWLQPLGDGKPLEAWPMTPWVWLGFHPLTVIRAVNVLVGAIGAALIYRLALHLSSSRWIAFVCGILFALCPFVVYLERLGLADNFLCVAGIWVFLNIVKFIESPTATRSRLLALSLVLAAFCKFPVGFVFVLSAPLAFVLMPRSTRVEFLQRSPRARLAVAFVPVAMLGLLVAVVTLVQLRRGQSLAFGLKDLIGIGLGNYVDVAETIGVPRMKILTELTAQLSRPVIAIGSVGIIASAIGGDWRQRWLIVHGLALILAIEFFTKFWYPRYLLFTLPPLIVASALGWESISLRLGRARRVIELSVLAICVVYMGRQSVLLITDPLAARWSRLDRIQYLEGWSSGYGYPEAAKFLVQSINPPAMVYSLDGHSAHQLLAYLPTEWADRVKPIMYGPNQQVLRTEAARLENLFAHKSAWIVIARQLLPSYLESTFGRASLDRIGLHELAEFNKPGVRSQLVLYEVSQR